MIWFNGQALERVAPVMVEDIRIGPIQRTVTARQRPIIGGADFVRVRDGGRTVTITFGLLVDDTDARQNALMAISRWAASDTEKRLIVPHRDGKFLSCICTNLQEPSMRQWWESRLSIVFSTYDNPYFTSIAERAVGCGTQLVTGGDAVPLMRIEATLIDESSNLIYSNGTQTMQFSGVPAGDLVIDLNRQTATLDGDSIMDKFVFGGDFITPRVGSQTITGTGTVLWRERWVG